jgi:hypothetical protein
MTMLIKPPANINAQHTVLPAYTVCIAAIFLHLHAVTRCIFAVCQFRISFS